MKTKVFVGWSGDQSKLIAAKLYEWIPDVIQSVDPFFSEEIEKGVEWFKSISDSAQESIAGVFCMTSENILSPWIHFEAGKISTMYFDKEKGELVSKRVQLLLFGIKPTDIRKPLEAFQQTMFDKNEMQRLMSNLNNLNPEPLEQKRLERLFNSKWDELQESINQILKSQPVAKPTKRETSDYLDEILSSVRRIERRTGSLALNNPAHFGAPIIRDMAQLEESVKYKDVPEIEKAIERMEIEKRMKDSDTSIDALPISKAARRHKIN